MQSESVKISGPVSLSILRDPKTDRYFYFFGDVHDSMDGTCSSLQSGLKCDRPNFLFTDVITANGNCWTISALLHELFEYHGKEGTTVDFYNERAEHDESYDTNNYAFVYEIIARRQGIYTEPRSREQLEVLKERVSSYYGGWLEDVYSMLWKKKYPPSIEILNGNARRFNDFQVVPSYDIREFQRFMKSVRETIENFAHTGSRDGYEFAMSEIIESIEDVLSLTEQLIASPFELLEYHFVPKDYVEATQNLIHYIPTTSHICKKLVQNLYKSISTGYGERSRTGQVASLSAASWARLRKVNPLAAELLLEFIKTTVENTAAEYAPKVDSLSQAFSSIDFRDSETITEFVSILDKVTDCLITVVLINSQVMDHYTLSEMLRRTAKHNILFAGAGHANVCTEFLGAVLGFEVIENIPMRSTDNGVIRCVDSSFLRELLSLDKARQYQQSK